MKICPFDKHVRKKFSEMFAAIGVIFSIVVAFFPIEQETRTVAGIVFASVCVVTYIGVWISAMLSKKVKLRIRNTNVVIQVGDIWEAPGKKVIPMNEFFDTENPGFIDENSLHGQFIRKYEGKGEDIYSHIISTLKSRGINGIVMKREQGKPIKFRLGTICEYDDIFMLAYTSFDKDNRANLYGDNFPKCYSNMWNEIDIHNNGESISMPVLGTGKTRFDKDYKPQELLEIMLITLRMSGVNLERRATLNIVIHKSLAKDINFIRLKSFSD
jgi:hypothetical protein